MVRHNGMRPQDIAILLKIAAKKDSQWMMKDLADELKISAGEVSESLSRSAFSGLIASDKKRLMKLAILDFLRFGLKYVYPAQRGPTVRGIPTAYSASPLNSLIDSEEAVVWPDANGTIKGVSVQPLIASLPKACILDEAFYELAALTEAMRIGKAREQQLAYQELEKRL